MERQPSGWERRTHVLLNAAPRGPGRGPGDAVKFGNGPASWSAWGNLARIPCAEVM